jgi:ATP-dependent RNA helicase HelY
VPSDRDSDPIRQLKEQIRRHPCHTCPEREDHARWAERYLALDRQTQAMRASVEQRTNTLGRDFDRVCQVLQALGYLDGDQVTDAGRMLCTLYTELDLLLAESIRSGVFDDLDERELAATVAGFVYQARTDNAPEPVLPTAGTRAAFVGIDALWRDLKAAEAQQRLTFLRPVDTGFVDATYQWASGADLAEVLMSAEIAPGDFVRWTKQVIDVLGQVADGAGPQVRAKARAGLTLVRRGLVLQAD